MRYVAEASGVGKARMAFRPARERRIESMDMSWYTHVDYLGRYIDT